MQAGGWTWRGIVVWDKLLGRPMKGRPRNHVEYVLWGSDGGMDGEDNPVYLPSVFRAAPPKSSERDHLTQKPLLLLSELVQFFAPGTTVLDPFMGSGTALLAAKNTGRKAIGIEIEERYCEIAARRLGQEVMDFGGLAA
jgi:site-specific DNA-methyltransferase (adenine-specific)